MAAKNLAPASRRIRLKTCGRAGLTMNPFNPKNLERLFQQSEHRKKFLFCFGLFVLVWIAFAPALKNGFVTYDDPDYITANSHVQQGLTWQNIGWAFTTTTTVNWHPLTWLSLMLDCQWFGLNPIGHHLVSLLFHAANSLLLFLLLSRMTGAVWRSFLVAVLFGLHPMHVESVAWASERKDLLSTFFAILTLLAYVSYTRKESTSESRESSASHSLVPRPSSLDHFLALFFFACGLMSKPMLVTLPFVLLLLDYWPLERIQGSKFKVQGLLVEKWPFFLLSAISSVVTFMAQNSGGAVVAITRLPLIDRIENAVVAYGRYLGKLFWPVDFAAFYPPTHWPIHFVLLVAIALISISVLVLVLRKHRYLVTGWLWFLGTLVPVIGLVQVGAQSMADRYSYIPAIGIFIAVVWGGWELLKNYRCGLATASMIVAATVLVCVPLTRRQVGYWHDGETLFRHTLAVTEDHYMNHYNLATAFNAAGKYDEGVQQLELALRLNANDAKVYNNLGFALDKQGRSDDAIANYRKALQLDPAYVDAMINLGITLGKTGQTAEAMELLEKALQRKPDLSEAHYNLGNLFVRNGRLDEGIAEYQAAIRLNPVDADAHNNLGVALSRMNRVDDAIIEFRAAIRLKPTPEMHNNVGTMFYRKGYWNEAIAEYQEALKLDPDDVEAKKNLGMAERKKSNLLRTPQWPVSTNTLP
jgi:protein O-mannosyl-transferase